MSENVKCVYPKDNEKVMAEYIFDITCTNCREPHDVPVSINRFEKHQMPGSRGEASFVMKCKFCGKDVSISMYQFEEVLYNAETRSEEVFSKIKEQRKKKGLRGVDTEKAILLEMDCRGCEINNLDVANITFVAELTSGKKMEFQFEGGENEWYDYDDDAGEEVFIIDFDSQVIKGK